MAGRQAVAPMAIAGTACAALSLGVDWYRPDSVVAPGRILDARVFLVVAIVAGVAGVVRPTRQRQACTAAVLFMLVGFGLAVRQLTLSSISPTALVVVAAAVAAFAAAARESAVPSHRGG